MQNRTDQELVTLFVERGNKAALGELFHRHINNVYRFVYLRVGNKEWSEDITSEVFTTFIQVAPNYNGKSTVSTFLIGIAVNKIRQFWQKLKNAQRLDDEYVIVDDEEETTENPVLKHLDAILQDLPEKYRQILECRFIKAMSIKETALILNISSENVRVMQHRALKQAITIAQEIINDRK